MTENINTYKLEIQLQEIESMKYILDIENQELSHENLKSQIDNKCRDNFTFLVILNNYLSEMPKPIKQAINNIIGFKDDEEKCRNLYEEYLDKFQTNQTFKEYQNYIFMQRAKDTIKDFKNYDLSDFAKIYEKVEKSLIKNKKIQLALLFNILFDLKGAFVPIDFVENLPQLTIWVNNNKEKPIEPLTDDECKIIAALMAGYYDKIFTFKTLSNLVKDYSDVDDIIQNLPVKFGVQNITQVMFRIYLLKPHIWNNTDYYDLVKSIKSVSDAVLV